MYCSVILHCCIEYNSASLQELAWPKSKHLQEAPVYVCLYYNDSLPAVLKHSLHRAAPEQKHEQLHGCHSTCSLLPTMNSLNPVRSLCPECFDMHSSSRALEHAQTKRAITAVPGGCLLARLMFATLHSIAMQMPLSVTLKRVPQHQCE